MVSIYVSLSSYNVSKLYLVSAMVTYRHDDTPGLEALEVRMADSMNKSTVSDINHPYN